MRRIYIGRNNKTYTLQEEVFLHGCTARRFDKMLEKGGSTFRKDQKCGWIKHVQEEYP